jgi:fructosamine-3-kinase
MWQQISDKIQTTIAQAFTITTQQSIGGGCINQGYRISDGSRNFFVKLNRADQLHMFEAEALGLVQMASTNTIRVPQPIGSGVAEASAYLVLEWLDLGRGQPQSWREMGRQLARMHQFSGSTAFGWAQNNTIGSTPQINDWTKDWATFWQIHRIGYQLQLGQNRGGNFPQAEALINAIPALLAGHHPHPSIVHGDLWGGNAAITSSGEPVIFDPATYWGDREVDLAMTELFGGFPTEFYSGYNEIYPIDRGYEQRKILYNLYHILNHYNLFGGSYLGQANHTIAQLLKS